MAVFPSFNLTKKGEELLNRSIGEGRVLTFTKFKLGDGVPTEDWRDLVNVQSSFKEFPVLETAIQADQVLRIRGYFDNKGFATDKQFKEIGVFVTLDGVAGEHLYSYTNAGDTGDIIPAESRGFYSRTLDVNNYIGYATNITFNIEQTRDNYDFNTEVEVKVAAFLKKGDKIRLWGRLVLGDIDTINYIVTDEVTSFAIDNGLYCKLAAKTVVADVENGLKNLKGAKIGDIVEVLGYYSKGDGAGHRRQKVAEGYIGEDKVIGVDGSIWGIVHSGEVNVSWFGARTGDFDNRESIQKAIDYSSCIVFDGEYKVKSFVGNNALTIRQQDGFVMKGRNERTSIIRFDLPSNIRSGLRLEDRCAYFVGENFSLEGELKVDTVFDANKYDSTDKFKPYMSLKNVRAHQGKYAFRISTYVATLEKVVAETSDVGFDLYIDSTETFSTSTTLTSCYANNCKIGFNSSYITYSNFISCASDHADISYNFNYVYGVNMLGCGSEDTKKLLNVETRAQAFGLDNLFVVPNSGNISELITINDPINTKLNGLCIIGASSNINKKLKVVCTGYPNVNLTVTDNSIRPSDVEVEGTSSEFGDNVIKYLRNEYHNQIVYTINNDNAVEVLTGISKIFKRCKLYNNIIIKLSANTTIPALYLELKNIKSGNGSNLTIDLNGFELTSTSATFNFIECDVLVKNGWLTYISGDTKTGILAERSNIIFENVIISNNGGASGRGACMSTSSNCTITLKNGTKVQGDWGYSTSNAVFRDDSTTQYNYEVVLAENINIPKNKALPLSSGGIVINKGNRKYTTTNTEWIVI